MNNYALYDRDTLMTKDKTKTKFDYFIILIGVYSISTLTQSLFPFSINRIIVFLLIIIMSFEKRIKKRKLVLYLYLVMLFISSTFTTSNMSTNLNDFVYYSVAVIQLCIFARKDSWEKLLRAYNRNSKFIYYVSIADFIIMLISFFNPSCYVQHWGEGTYLYGFTKSGHAMAASCCLALSLTALSFFQKKVNIMQFIIIGLEVVIIMKTGARVFIIPTCLIAYYFIKRRVKNKRIRMIVYAMAMLAFLFIFLKSNMIKKFIFTIQDPYKNSSSLIESLTSGRSNFWKIDLVDYINSNIFYKIWGHGFTYIYKLNLKYAGMEIWAHNDFINILVSCGLVGLVIYISMLFRTLTVLKKLNSRFTYMMLLLYALFPAMINGFYSYYHYFSSFFIFALATLLTNNKEINRDGED